MVGSLVLDAYKMASHKVEVVVFYIFKSSFLHFECVSCNSDMFDVLGYVRHIILYCYLLRFVMLLLTSPSAVFVR